ncbi:MAG: hypothetical protein WBZ11_05490 [Candidatus Sulfotelmatobacter sp.]|jgi:hypothetical protein
MKPEARSARKQPAAAHSGLAAARLLWLALFVSLFSFLFYYRNGDLLLYGDAVAHINIARRIFDSRTPGILQLGTVWLPLPHLLILPFIISKQMWQSGSGGSIPSMAAFIVGVLGIFRLTRTALRRGDETDGLAKVGAWAAAIVYIANPNLIYMQATAMGESIFLAFFIWAVAFFAEFARGNNRSLLKCGWCLAAACLTRYDGWFLTALVVLAALAMGMRKREANIASPINAEAAKVSDVPLRGSTVKFVLMAMAAPVLWLGYNAAVYRNPLEFANGPYSAKAIAQKSNTVNPAQGNVLAAGSYFLKAAELNVTNSTWPGRVWLALAALGSLATLFKRHGLVALLLWSPLPFYALSIAYGSVPIFVPTWWPFSIYNARYGLELLPAFAVFMPLGVYFLVQFACKLFSAEVFAKRWAEVTAFVAILLLVTSSYAAVWRNDPICLREALVNSRGRIALDKQLEDWLKSLPANSTLLMYLGDHVDALERAGVPLKSTINEGNHRVWKQPSDPEGLWERALADPTAYANYILGFKGDPVWNAAMARHLPAIVEIHVTGQPPAVIFQGGTQPKAGVR